MLSEEYFQELATDYFAEQWAVDKAVTLMMEIEAEVRKQDDALIQQLVEALEGSTPIAMGKAEQRNTALIAGRARLGEKT